jgi:hypothetical protein
MKKNLLILAVILLSFANSYSQETFSTGAMDVYVGTYGKIRLFTPDGTRHLQRATILVGTSSTAVFDHENDAEVVDPTSLVTSPLSSDFEIYGAYDNSYSGLPPAVLVKLNAYGWNNAAYTVVKYNVKNNEATTMNALIGLEILPELNQEYGFDTVTYNDAEGVIRFHRGTQENMGFKLLSASLSSLYSFEWYDLYQVDSDFWTWMNYDSLQPEYISTTVDGPVSITSQPSVSIAPGETFTVFYALALGTDEQAMLDNIAAAKQKYELLTVSVAENQPAAGELSNYPNPFTSSTKISYQLPGNGFASLKVYDALGNVKATLVNEKQTGGFHTIDFDAKGLQSGVYSYRLSFNDQVITNRMMLVK